MKLKLRSKNGFSYENKKSLYGFLFCLPWILGFIMFFLMPFAQSIMFSFSKVSTGDGGFNLDYVGFENFRYALYDDKEYVPNLLSSITGFAYKVPIILILSLIIAVVLNGKFKGRTFFRSLFFIPAIISTGVVMNYIAGDSVMEAMRNSGGADTAYSSELIDFNAVFNGLGLPIEFGNMILGYLQDIFDLVWSCGIQIVLFVSGLQSIPVQLYEVSKVEGATKWEEFWYVTVPLLRHSILLVMVFTAIEYCSSMDNPAMRQAYAVMQKSFIYHRSAAMMWLFFLVIGAIFGLVVWIVQHFIFRKWD